MEKTQNTERKNPRGDKPKCNKKKFRETQFSHKHKGMDYTDEN